MRAVVYSRISRDDEGQGLGVARQEEDCRELINRRGWTEVTCLTENDTSAFSGRLRPQYQRLLELIKLGAVDVVVAWAPERLHRAPRELEDFIELIDEHHVAVETVRAGTWDVSSASGRMVARMLGAVSRAESEKTGERVSRAHQQAKANGYWRGPIPFGMRATATPGLPEPDPETCDLVTEIGDRILRGEALTAIAADLNKRGLKPKRGESWTHTGVDRLLSSPAIGGLVSSENELIDAKFSGIFEPPTWRDIRGAYAHAEKRSDHGEADPGWGTSGVMNTTSVSGAAINFRTYCCRAERYVRTTDP